ncbi:MAG: OsmC family protein [Caldilineaceae bacterium]|jgi:putative redox protein
MGKISTYYKGEMLFESEMGNHKLTIDVPAAMGGSDRGPTPPELFVASLGSCIGAFVANYCAKSGVDATDLRVDVTFDKMDNPTRLVNLSVSVFLPHGECKNRREAMHRVAEHCPVHETITSMEQVEMKIFDKTEMAVAG